MSGIGLKWIFGSNDKYLILFEFFFFKLRINFVENYYALGLTMMNDAQEAI